MKTSHRGQSLHHYYNILAKIMNGWKIMALWLKMNVAFTVILLYHCVT